MQSSIIEDFKKIITSRRATRTFRADPVPDEILEELLSIANLAPSGFNLQPWRFVVVKDAENKKRLWAVGYNQSQIEEAPVVLICCGDKNWQKQLKSVWEEAKARKAATQEFVDYVLNVAPAYFATQSLQAWAFKHTMIAVTYIIIAAQMYGLNTSPMEGFDSVGVKKEFNIPQEWDPVCLLAIGYGSQAYNFPGRRDWRDLVFYERVAEKR